MSKIEPYLHVLAQLLGLAAVSTLVPVTDQKYYLAVVAIVGVLVAYFGPYSTPSA